MTQKIQKLTISILFILLIWGLGHNFLNNSVNNFKNHCSSAEKTILKFQNDFNKFSNDEKLINKIISNDLNVKEIKEFNDQYFFQFIYKGNNLIYWNNNSVVPEVAINQIEEEGSLLLMKNGYYAAFSKKHGEYSIIGMMLIKYNYSIENQYLNNVFSDKFEFKKNINIEYPDFPEGFSVKNRQGKTIFKVVYSEESNNEPIKHEIVISYFTIIVFWVLIFILFNYLNKKYSLRIAFIGMLVASVTFYLMIVYLNFEFKKTIFFNPELYASQYYGNSLGYVTTNTLIFFILGTIASICYMKNKWDFNKITYTLYTLFVFILFYLFNTLVRSIILDSVISFEINNFTFSNIYTFIGILIIIFISITVFIYLYIWAAATKRAFFKASPFIVLTFFIIEGVLLYYTIHNIVALISPLISCIILMIFIYLIKNKKHLNKFNFSLSSSLLFSLLISSLLTIYNVEDEDLRKSVIANQLSENRDRIAEFKFNEIQKEIKDDSFFKKFFVSPFVSQRELQQRLNYLYFGSYMSKYNVNSIAFNVEGKAIKTTDTISLQYYTDLIEDKGSETTSEWLYLIPKTGGKNNYLSILPIENDGVISGTLVLELSEKTYQKENLYPELLIEQKSSSIAQYRSISDYRNVKEYDYAIYKNDYLIAQSGEYPFPFFFGAFNLVDDFPNVKVENHFRLNFFKIDQHLKVIISVPEASVLTSISTFSYIFCFNILLLIITYVIVSIINVNDIKVPMRPIRLTFKNRINLAILLISISSFIIIAIVTIGYFTELYKANNTDTLIKKQKSVLSSIEYLLNKQNAESLNKLPSNFGAEIASLAEIHGIDINIFNKDGELVYSSQPSIFGNGLISKKMNPIAKYNLLKLSTERFIQNEWINKLHYESVYVPIRIKTGESIAVLNLPYFAQEETLRKELSKLMVALVNVYVLLLIISTFIAFLISKSITSPLANISEKLSLISLGKRNEPIEWDSDDEIGALVKEYNKMIRQIEESAFTLAQSERESAWREMARQIAHEIKNPLTPMKLSIQHLQRTLKADPENAIHLAERVGKTIVEQIDNLSEIATAFSSFAQMPTANKENIDLIEIIQNVSNLFNQTGSTKISFEKTLENAYVYSDKNQLLSVFNNLVKNALQATEETKDAWVKILIKEKNGEYIISIEDNGEGMSEERRAKVFVPNFTTKSGGTGLGLAISKQIIVNSNGVIWFKTIKNIGTTFYVSLPKSINE